MGDFFSFLQVKQLFYVIGKILLCFSAIFSKCFISVQSLSHVWLIATPWTATCQASLSIINFQSSPKLMSIESVMPSNHLICVVPFSSCPQSFPASRFFPMSQLFASGGQSIGVSASASVLPVNTQDGSPFGWTGWISLKSKGFSRIFSNFTQKGSSMSDFIKMILKPVLYVSLTRKHVSVFKVWF